MGETVKESGDASSELVKSISDKHASLVRPAAKYYSALKDAMVCGKGRYKLVKDVEEVGDGIIPLGILPFAAEKDIHCVKDEDENIW